jgi:hypothetical protein
MHQTHLERVVRLAPGAAQVTRSLAEADAAAERAAERRRAGLDAVLASLQAAKKVNVLDKSRADWSTFKQANTEARARARRARLRQRPALPRKPSRQTRRPLPGAASPVARACGEEGLSLQAALGTYSLSACSRCRAEVLADVPTNRRFGSDVVRGQAGVLQAATAEALLEEAARILPDRDCSPHLSYLRQKSLIEFLSGPDAVLEFCIMLTALG